jgi:arginase
MPTLQILGIPLDLGTGRRGVDMGPSAMRLAKLDSTLAALGHHLVDLGNVAQPVPEALTIGPTLPYAEAIATACQQTFELLRATPANIFSIALGGDHSIAMGSIGGVAQAGRTGVLWIDAHADLNTPETSPSGNIHGMPLAHLLGYGVPSLLDIWGGGACVQPQDIVLIGIRNLDEGERALIRELEIATYTMKDIDRLGIACVAEAALTKLADLPRLHVSFDADVLDPSVAPGVGTPVPGGLSYREAHLLMELLADAKRVTSLDLVEVNPILDIRNNTAQMMVEMAASLLGKKIL